MNASSGATSAGITTSPRRPSLKKIASAPSATKTAPTIPPISAWDELDGKPKYHVIRFHAIAPTSPANTASSPIEFGSNLHDVLSDRGGDSQRDERAHEVQHRRIADRDPRRHRAR